MAAFQQTNKTLYASIQELLQCGESVDKFFDALTGAATGLKKHPFPVKPAHWKFLSSNKQSFEADCLRYAREVEDMKKTYAGAFHVQYIAGHRMYKSKPEVIVAWYGYSDLTWELWKNVKETTMAKKYADENNIAFFHDHISIKHDHDFSEEIW
jgi:hypothetical protein